jgi:hypothetical protein
MVLFLTTVCVWSRFHDPEYKFKIYVKIAQLYLEEDQEIRANTFLNKASYLVGDVKDEGWKLRYKVRIRPIENSFFSYRQLCVIRRFVLQRCWTIRESSLKPLETTTICWHTFQRVKDLMLFKLP